MIEELKAAAELVRTSGPTDERQHFYQAEAARRLLAEHGPALIAAVELAEAVDTYDHEDAADRRLETDPLSTPELQAAYRALDAYRAAKREAK